MMISFYMFVVKNTLIVTYMTVHNSNIDIRADASFPSFTVSIALCFAQCTSYRDRTNLYYEKL